MKPWVLSLVTKGNWLPTPNYDYPGLSFEMTTDPSLLLESMLANPLEPAWSSFMLESMFAGIPGGMKEKMGKVLPQIDLALSQVPHALTDVQYNFLRAVTLHSYYRETRVVFSQSDLDWLLERFESEPTPQRAAMIGMLLLPEDLPGKTQGKMIELLRGTKGENLVG